LLQANQSCVNRPLIEQNLIAADLFDPPRDAVSMLLSHGRECLQDHQVQSSLEEIQFVVHAASCVITT
jgi:hypothetical protein